MNGPRGIKAAASLLNLIGDYSSEDFMAASELLGSNTALAELAIHLAITREKQEMSEKAHTARRSASSGTLEKGASAVERNIVSSNLNSSYNSARTPAPNQNPAPSGQTPVQLASKFADWFHMHYPEVQGYLRHPRFLPDGVLSALTDLAMNAIDDSHRSPSTSRNASMESLIQHFFMTLESPSLSPQKRLESILMLLELMLNTNSDLFFRFVAITVAALSQNRLMFPSVHDILILRKPASIRMFEDERLSAAFAVLMEILRSSPGPELKDLVFVLLRKALISPSDGPVSIIKSTKVREKK